MENSSAKKASVIAELFAIENRLSRQAAALGFRFILAPARIKKRLESLDEGQLSWVGENLDFFSRTLVLATDEGVDVWDDREFLNLSMRSAGLSFPQNFYDYVRPNQVVEAYDMHRRQTFRNMYFMEISNYSLLEVLTYDWPMLFHRDSDVTSALIRQSEQDLWAMNQVIKCDVPVHYIRELLSDEPQICEVQQQYLAPLFAGPNVPGGALVVSSARPLGLDKAVDRENLAFI